MYVGKACGEDCTGEPPQTQMPAVINWHGCNNHTPVVDYQLEVSRVEAAAADRGWYSITPVGTAIEGHYGWNSWGIDCAEPGADDTGVRSRCFVV
jgi:hypothetical protein